MNKIYFCHEEMLAAKRIKEAEYRSLYRERINARKRDARGAPIRGRYDMIVRSERRRVRRCRESSVDNRAGDEREEPVPIFVWDNLYRRLSMILYLTPSQILLGDPLPGRSMLDRLMGRYIGA